MIISQIEKKYEISEQYNRRLFNSLYTPDKGEWTTKTIHEEYVILSYSIDLCYGAEGFDLKIDVKDFDNFDVVKFENEMKKWRIMQLKTVLKDVKVEYEQNVQRILNEISDLEK